MSTSWSRDRLTELDSVGLFRGAGFDPDPHFTDRRTTTMRLNLTTDEAQALLDGINVVIREKTRDLAFFSETLDLDNPQRTEIITNLRKELDVAKSARRKIQEV